MKKEKISPSEKAEDKKIIRSFLESCRRSIAKGALISASINGRLIYRDPGHGQRPNWDPKTFIKCLSVATNNDLHE